MNSGYSDPELHKKICKKMAQLTRVIYQMNTRNDENDLTLKQFITAYEKEMDTLVEEANTVIGKFKVQLEKSNKQDELEATVQKISDQVQKDKDSARREFSTLKQKVDEREKKMSHDYEVWPIRLISQI
jgi:hypothetical protein